MLEESSGCHLSLDFVQIPDGLNAGQAGEHLRDHAGSQVFRYSSAETVSGIRGLSGSSSTAPGTLPPRQVCSNPVHITIPQTLMVVIAGARPRCTMGCGPECPGCCNGKRSLVSSTNCSPCSQQLRRRRSPKSLRSTFKAPVAMYGGQCPLSANSTDGVASRGSECVTSIACRGLSSLSLLARMERRDQYNANR